jgi:hypothetical protein
MIIYNETFVVEASAGQEWLQWMQKEHIPAAMATGYFTEYKILEVLDSPNEGVTYCIQYVTDDLTKYNLFKERYLQNLHVRHHQKFENRYVLFNSLMKYIN